MWGFRKKEEEVFVPPATFDATHQFQSPVNNGSYPAINRRDLQTEPQHHDAWQQRGYPNYAVGWAPRVDEEIFPNQAKPTYYRPKPYDPPAHFWQEGRGEDALTRGTQEKIDARYIPIHPRRQNIAPDPRWTPPPTSRVTNNLSPHNWSFSRPWEPGSARNLNGMHFSLADNHRNFPVGGMLPSRQWRNTYRLQPSNRDTQNQEVPTQVSAPIGADYAQAPISVPTRGTAYRL